MLFKLMLFSSELTSYNYNVIPFEACVYANRRILCYFLSCFSFTSISCFCNFYYTILCYWFSHRLFNLWKLFHFSIFTLIGNSNFIENMFRRVEFFSLSSFANFISINISKRLSEYCDAKYEDTFLSMMKFNPLHLVAFGLFWLDLVCLDLLFVVVIILASIMSLSICIKYNSCNKRQHFSIAYRSI